MRQFCRRHSYRGGKSAAELVSRLRAAPASADPIADQVLEAIVRSSVAQIGLLNAEITRLERQLADALAAHPKTALLQTLPRVATVSLAALIAEIGPLLERCENPEQVAAMCGAAPVTRASGKSRNVGFRYTANKPARVAITSFADNSRHRSAWAADCLPSSAGARCSTPTRRADPRPGLGAGDLGMLDHRHPLRPRHDTAANSGSSPPDLTKRAQAVHQPRAVPGHHRNAGPLLTNQLSRLTSIGASSSPSASPPPSTSPSSTTGSADLRSRP